MKTQIGITHASLGCGKHFLFRTEPTDLLTQNQPTIKNESQTWMTQLNSIIKKQYITNTLKRNKWKRGQKQPTPQQNTSNRRTHQSKNTHWQKCYCGIFKRGKFWIWIGIEINLETNLSVVIFQKPNDVKNWMHVLRRRVSRVLRLHDKIPTDLLAIDPLCFQFSKSP